MNFKVLIASLALTSSSVAFASPVLRATADASFQARVGLRVPAPTRLASSVRDHRDVQVQPVQPPSRPRYLPVTPASRSHEVSGLGEATVYVGFDTSTYVGSMFSIAASRHERDWVAITEPTRIESGREFINLTAAGPVSRLMLENVTGRTLVSQVALTFADGSTQVIKLDRMLHVRSRWLDLGLDGRDVVTKIAVYGESSEGSAYRLLAR